MDCHPGLGVIRGLLGTSQTNKTRNGKNTDHNVTLSQTITFTCETVQRLNATYKITTTTPTDTQIVPTTAAGTALLRRRLL